MKKMCVCLMLVMSAAVMAGNVIWDGEQSNAWENAFNWSLDKLPDNTTSIGAQIDALVSGRYPVISTDGSCFTLRLHSTTVAGNTSVTMVSGNFTVGLDDVKILSNKAGNTDTFYMQGGTLTATDKFYIGYYAGLSVLDMSGGIINTVQLVATGADSATAGHARIYLSGGNLRCGSFVFRRDAIMDISGGVFTIEGDATAAVQQAVTAGYLKALGGAGIIVYDYNITEAGYTTVIGEMPSKKALDPVPSSGAVDISVANLQLSWTAGPGAVSHKLYLGLDPDNLSLAADSTATSYLMPSAELGATYYWRVDEVDSGNNVTTGYLWTFATINYLVVDDFESYIYNSSDPNNIWSDGGGVELEQINEGLQAMRMIYNNPGAADSSTAKLVFASAQDWDVKNVKALLVHYHGAPNNTVDNITLSVRLQDTSLNSASVNFVTTEMLKAADFTPWMTWMMDLNAFASAGVDLNNIANMSLVVSGQGYGELFIDDIRLYIPRDLAIAYDGDFNNNGTADYTDYSILADQWLKTTYTVTVSPIAVVNAPIAWYRFEETSGTAAADSIHTGDTTYSGTSDSSSIWSIGSGLDGGNCINLDGVAKGIAIPMKVFDTVTNELTVSLWTKGDETYLPSTTVYAFGGLNAPKNKHLFSGVIPDANGQVVFSSGDDILVWVNGIMLEDFAGQWNHYAFVKNVNTNYMAIYCNGDLCAYIDGENVDDILEDIAYFQIGGSPTGSYKYRGQLDEVKIFDYALSQGEIMTLAGKTDSAVNEYRLSSDVNYDDIVNAADLKQLIKDWVADPVLWP